MRKRHIVVLSEEERARLHTMIGRGVAPASALTHARILLKANQGQAGPGWTDAAIAVALEVNPATVRNVNVEWPHVARQKWLHPTVVCHQLRVSAPR